MKLIYLSELHLSIGLVLLVMVKCQITNRAPQFVPGSGDMARFSLSENTPVGSPIYQLRGKDFCVFLIFISSVCYLVI